MASCTIVVVAVVVTIRLVEGLVYQSLILVHPLLWRVERYVCVCVCARVCICVCMYVCMI